MNQDGLRKIHPEIRPLLELSAAFHRSMPSSPRREDEFTGTAVQLMLNSTRELIEEMNAPRLGGATISSIRWDDELIEMRAWLEVCFAAGAEVAWGNLTDEDSERITDQAYMLYAKHLVIYMGELIMAHAMTEDEAAAHLGHMGDMLGKAATAMRNRGYAEARDFPRLNDELLDGLRRFADEEK